MKTLDRYVLRNFLTTAVMFLAVMLLLRIVVDLFINIDEFAEIETAGISGKILHVLSYYSVQSLAYFTELGGVVIVVSAAFAVARMNQSNELTAMLASGVSLYRVTTPIVICAMLIGGLIIVDQEWLIPKVAHRLVLDRDEVPEAKHFEIRLMTDGRRSIWYAHQFQAGTKHMDHPVVVVRNAQGAMELLISGQEAHPYTLQGQDGWLISQAKLAQASRHKEIWPHIPDCRRIFSGLGPQEILEAAQQVHYRVSKLWLPLTNVRRWPNAKLEVPRYRMTLQTECFVPQWPEAPDGRVGGRLEKPVFSFHDDDGSLQASFIAKSASWQWDEEKQSGYWQLTSGALFYPTDLSSDDLVLKESSEWVDYMSTTDLTKLIQLKRVPDRRTAEQTKHIRFTAPINNLLMLLLGLPFILSRERNIKASAGLCLLTVGSFYCFIYICRYMGLPPMLAAWLPIFLFGSMAVIMLDAVKT